MDNKKIINPLTVRIQPQTLPFTTPLEGVSEMLTVLVLIFWFLLSLTSGKTVAEKLQLSQIILVDPPQAIILVLKSL